MDQDKVSTEPLVITDEAARRLAEYMEKNGRNKGVRIKLRRGG